MEKKKYERPRVSREQLEEELLIVNETLWLANRKLENEENARMELFSNLSHDLRSPITALVSSVEYLKSNEDINPEEKRAVLDLMERRLRGMESMINDIFLLTKVESPTLELHKENLELNLFLEEFFYDCVADNKYAERDLQLELDETSVMVSIDPPQMSRVLDNLFTNALKYSEEGAQITLRTQVFDKWVWISVEDTGIGISEEDIKHIFERSYRATKSRTPGDGSSGLGLAIAKGITKKHGGSISCTSELGKGSCFTMKIPIVND